MRTKERIIASAIVATLVYLAFAFAAASFDITTWNSVFRGYCACFMLLLVLGILAFPSEPLP